MTHVIVAAFSVEGEDRAAAMASLMEGFREMGACGDDNVFGLECWWLAEDDRIEGSDNDSAIFVHPGRQHEAVQLLHSLGMTGDCNLTMGTHGSPQGFTGEQI